jgi:hypothetical protein
VYLKINSEKSPFGEHIKDQIFWDDTMGEPLKTKIRQPK